MNHPDFIESDMIFSFTRDDVCWQIEKSEIYRKISQGVPIAEFILLRGKSIWVVEARTSFSNPEEGGFDSTLDQITQKLFNSWLMLCGVRLNLHGKPGIDELPDGLRSVDLGEINVKLVLVIKNHKDEWLKRLQETFDQRLKQQPLLGNRRALGVRDPRILVLNEALAVQRSLIVGG